MPQNLSPTSIADTPLKKERPKTHKRRANDDRRRDSPLPTLPPHKQTSLPSIPSLTSTNSHCLSLMTRPTTTPLPPPRIYPSLTTIIRHLKTQFKFLPHSSTTPTPHKITTICGHRCPRSKKNQGHIERYGDTVPTTRKSSFGSQWMDGGFAKSPTTTKNTGASHSKSYPTQTPSTTRTDPPSC